MSDVKQQIPDEIVTSAGALDVNNLQIAGSSIATAATGIQKVGVTDASGNALNSTSNSLNVAVQPETAGGFTIYSASVGATKTQVKSSAGQLYGWYIFNSNTSTVYIQLFDVANASITLGTTAPTFSLGVPAGAAANVFTEIGIPFATAINWAATTTRTGSTGPSNTVDVNFFYK